MKRLFIDVPALKQSGVPVDQIECEYVYHRVNDGALTLLEIAEFASYCRRCEDAFCVAACPKDALERLESGIIKRWNMRCVGCKSCIVACPFGTIFTEVMNYISAKCDCCLNQLADNPEYLPECVRTAPAGSFQMVEIAEQPEKHIFWIGEHLAVKSPSWLQKEGKR
jgi:Fe-S-cluster-containing dehydrogenase component